MRTMAPTIRKPARVVHIPSIAGSDHIVKVSTLWRIHAGTILGWGLIPVYCWTAYGSFVGVCALVLGVATLAAQNLFIRRQICRRECTNVGREPAS